MRQTAYALRACLAFSRVQFGSDLAGRIDADPADRDVGAEADLRPRLEVGARDLHRHGLTRTRPIRSDAVDERPPWERSEERRVGKDGRGGGGAEAYSGDDMVSR